MAKTLLLVNPTELEIFQQDLVAKTLLLVNPTELEIFQQDSVAKALSSCVGREAFDSVKPLHGYYHLTCKYIFYF